MLLACVRRELQLVGTETGSPGAGFSGQLHRVGSKARAAVECPVRVPAPMQSRGQAEPHSSWLSICGFCAYRWNQARVIVARSAMVGSAEHMQVFLVPVP